jgi:hypothetical protein
MRTISRAGLAGVAAVVLLTSCGGNNSTSSSSSGSSATTSSSSAASSGSAGASGSEFCTQAVSVLSQLGSAAQVQDPTQLGPVLQQAATQLKSLNPPSAIATDWNALVNAVSQLGQAASTTDFTNAEQAQAFQQQASELQTQLGGSEAKVQSYLTNQCGITSSTGSTAPTS